MNIILQKISIYICVSLPCSKHISFKAQQSHCILVHQSDISFNFVSFTSFFSSVLWLRVYNSWILRTAYINQTCAINFVFKFYSNWQSVDLWMNWQSIEIHSKQTDLVFFLRRYLFYALLNSLFVVFFVHAKYYLARIAFEPWITIGGSYEQTHKK